jgi:hypothetical protein
VLRLPEREAELIITEPTDRIICGPATQKSGRHHSADFATYPAAGPSQTNLAGKAKEPGGNSKQNAPRIEKNQTPNKKRRRNRKNKDGRSSDDEDKGDPGDNDPQGPSGPGGEEDKKGNRLFACPWYRFDPDHDYRCAGKYHLKTFRAVVEHCRRCHMLPQYYCSLCWTRFNNLENLSRHSPRRNCTPIDRPEELSGPEEHLLNTNSKLNQAERWFELWNNVFQGYPRPASPYLQPGIAEPASVLVASQSDHT